MNKYQSRFPEGEEDSKDGDTWFDDDHNNFAEFMRRICDPKRVHQVARTHRRIIGQMRLFPEEANAICYKCSDIGVGISKGHKKRGCKCPGLSLELLSKHALLGAWYMKGIRLPHQAQTFFDSCGAQLGDLICSYFDQMVYKLANGEYNTR